MSIIAIIPARIASSRFPGKPLAKINGIPMIGHVYFRCRMCSLVDEVFVATCDPEIRDYIKSIGGSAMMTADTHERCTDRTVEALQTIEKSRTSRFDIVLMVQGDEPMITPDMLSAALQPMLDDPEIKVVNLMGTIGTREEHNDANEVKVVVDLQGNALYFSREPIPSWKRGASSVPMQKQICIIPFRRDFLMTYSQMMPTPLEVVESVDMMRIIEHGFKVRMIPTTAQTRAVDTVDDLHYVETVMAVDPLVAEYGNIKKDKQTGTFY